MIAQSTQGKEAELDELLEELQGQSIGSPETAGGRPDGGVNPTGAYFTQVASHPDFVQFVSSVPHATLPTILSAGG